MGKFEPGGDHSPGRFMVVLEGGNFEICCEVVIGILSRQGLGDC